MKKFFILGFMTLSIIFAMDDIERALQAFNDRDYTQAMKLFDKACEGGDMRGCASLGGMYYYGDGVEQSYSKALKLLQKACNGGDMISCETLKEIQQ